MAVPLIRGLQGNASYGDRYPLAGATSKHFFGYNLESNFAPSKLFPHGGTDGQYRLRANLNITDTDLVQTYLPGVCCVLCAVRCALRAVCWMLCAVHCVLCAVIYTYTCIYACSCSPAYTAVHTRVFRASLPPSACFYLLYLCDQQVDARCASSHGAVVRARLPCMLTYAVLMTSRCNEAFHATIVDAEARSIMCSYNVSHRSCARIM